MLKKGENIHLLTKYIPGIEDVYTVEYCLSDTFCINNNSD